MTQRHDKIPTSNDLSVKTPSHSKTFFAILLLAPNYGELVE